MRPQSLGRLCLVLLAVGALPCFSAAPAASQLLSPLVRSPCSCLSRTACAALGVTQQCGERIEGSQAEQLLALQNSAPDGVVSLNTAAFNRFAALRSRPYEIAVFVSAKHLLDKPQLKLRDLRNEWGYLGKAFAKDSAVRGKLFLVALEVTDANEVIHRLDLQTLPHIFHIPASANLEGDSKIKISAEDVMQAVNYQKYPWTADDMNDFVAERTGLKATGVERPSFLKSPLFPIAMLSFLSAAAFVGYHLYYAEFMKNTIIWTAAIIFVYWFSVSGGMHNIIRGVPMQHWDRATGKVVLFMQSGQGQLGAEGFIMGSLYCTVGLCVALLTQAAPKVFSEDRSYQRYAAYFLLAAALYAYSKIREIYTWKTGHSPRWYL